MNLINLKNNQISFLPFQAINEFMRPDYREAIIRTVLSGLPNVSDANRIALERAINTYVHIPGFRKSIKAPHEIKQKYIQESFEKLSVIAALILTAWSEIHPRLRETVYLLLTNLHWQLLPLSVDRSKLPGFYTTWPNGQEFDSLYDSYQKQFPDDKTSKDDISLMIVWLSCRLPYEFVDDIFNNSDQPNELIR